MKATFKSIMKIFLTTETFGKEKCSGEIKNKKFVTFRIKLFSSLVMENGPAKINPELLFQLQIIQHPGLLIQKICQKKNPSVIYKWDWMDWIGRAFG